MTERKTKAGPLSIFRRVDAGNVPAPWVPPELPASKDALGGAVAKRDRSDQLPAPWVPAALPASTRVPAVAKDDGKLAKLKPWAPAAEAPRNLPAAIPENDDAKLPEPQKRKKRGKRRSGELASQNTGGGQPIINIVNQVQAPAPVYVSPWWGWWGGCTNVSCPRHYGRACFRVWCWWW